ncbi:hypothetical protein QBC47DRAFT_166342 [Echria macrotheca]|uniref:AA1-like domain-containing protein n=1 Tax=Echria macrotheca TaxID=438768 RepID=A0AAJ0F7F0_9PEZI|nr:hypothetical protein QBC47DRAFT_166342 [Echria macrotheca]
MSTKLTTLSLLLLGTFSLTTAAPAPAPIPDLTPSSSSSSSSCSNTSFQTTSLLAQSLSLNTSVLFTTPSHAVEGGYLSFTVLNPAFPSTPVECTAADTRKWEFFYGDQWFNCPSPTSSSESGSRIVETKFRYTNRGETRYLAYVGGTVEIEQRWRCAGEDGGDSITFKASAAADITLSCDIHKSQNPNWTNGATYASNSMVCAKQDWEVEVNEISAVA